MRPINTARHSNSPASLERLERDSRASYAVQLYFPPRFESLAQVLEFGPLTLKQNVWNSVPGVLTVHGKMGDVGIGASRAAQRATVSWTVDHPNAPHGWSREGTRLIAKRIFSHGDPQRPQQPLMFGNMQEEVARTLSDINTHVTGDFVQRAILDRIAEMEKTHPHPPTYPPYGPFAKCVFARVTYNDPTPAGPWAYVLEDTVEGDWAKFVNNMAPRSCIEAHQPQVFQELAQLCLFWQHVCYELTGGAMLLTDYQGTIVFLHHGDITNVTSGSLKMFTDPQILTPKVGHGERVFGCGNVAEFHGQFAEAHDCKSNQWCQHFKMSRPKKYQK